MNSDKIILDLCGGTGSWSKPFKENGYDVRLITLPEYDVRSYKPPLKVYGILAAPPCTEFSVLNCKAEPRQRDEQSGLQIVQACLRIISQCTVEAFVAIENPRGFLRNHLGNPKLSFQPWQYGDPWTKQTDIWGDFNIPHPLYTDWNDVPKLDLYTRPNRGKPSFAFLHKSAWGDIPQLSYHKPTTDAEFRAMTPPGFAKAFYEANKQGNNFNKIKFTIKENKKSMQIIKLELRNFQGVKYLKLDFEGENADIFGKNASGKTTIKNAHCWLLVGRAGDGIKNYTPKTNDENGGYLHNLEHSAEETLRRDDGSIITYKKVYHEVYKKTNGTGKEVPSGNTIDYFVNSVPTTEKDYLLSVSTLGDPEQLKILTIPEYFPSELPWEKRRRILLTLCDKAITDDDVIASAEELKGIKEYLLMPGTTNQFYTVEDYKKIAEANKAEIKKQKNTIPARINEAERAIPLNSASYDKTAIQAELTEYRTEKENLDRKRAESKTSGAATQAARTARQNAEAKLNDEKSLYLQNINKQNEAAVNKVNGLIEEASALVRSITAHSTKVTDAQAKEKLLTAKRNELIGKYTKRAADVWDSTSESCPTCNRALPAEDVERLKSDFNKAKSTDLLKISAEGKAEASADMITGQQNIAHNAQVIADSLTAKHKELCALIDSERAKVVKTAFEETAAYKTLTDEIEACRAKELEAKTETGDNDAKHMEELTAITENISQCEIKLEQIKTRKTQLDRMEVLKEEEKRYSKEIESLEAGIFMCDTFTRQKVKLLDSSINSRFENVRFRLFIDQVNGGLREDCEVLIPSPDGNLVPYSTANGGAKIIAGIEIIKVLSEHWNMNVPLFVDNAESITSDYGIDGQMIRLTANKADEVLRVEYYSDKEKETA